MATQPVQMLAKPGMGTDEAFMIAHNEMKRILALKDIIGKREVPKAAAKQAKGE